MPTTAPVNASALALKLDRSEKSETELARRTAWSTGGSVESIRPSISKVIHGKRASHDAAAVAVWERELGVRPGDLAVPPTWLWQRGATTVALGASIIAGSSPDKAHAMRRALTDIFAGMVDPFEAARLEPALASEVDALLAVNLGDLTEEERSVALRVDPSDAELRALALLHVALGARDECAREGAVLALADAGYLGLLSIDLDAIHALMLKRLRAEYLPAELRERWEREESRLMDVLAARLRRDRGRL